MDALSLHRIQFAFTITYHYLFPQLTMGLTLLIVLLKTWALRTTDPGVSRLYDTSARFWGRLFAINFLLGVVTGIPMEFQFGTNWSEFSRQTGGVIGMPLDMEGILSFFLESSFLGLYREVSSFGVSWPPVVTWHPCSSVQRLARSQSFFPLLGCKGGILPSSRPSLLNTRLRLVSSGGPWAFVWQSYLCIVYRLFRGKVPVNDMDYEQ